MGRWEPNAKSRLRAAALDLFFERGYEETTVSDIAERAGLTPRTFFRHFADKREVLFDGSQHLQQVMVAALVDAAQSAGPIAAIARALDAASGFFSGNREFARRRSAVIAANAQLHERELIKLAKLSAALAEALQSRGVPDLEASLAAEVGIAIFRTGFARWIDASEERSFREIVAESFQVVRALATEP